jgi:hypothetical protein
MIEKGYCLVNLFIMRLLVAVFVFCVF